MSEYTLEALILQKRVAKAILMAKKAEYCGTRWEDTPEAKELKECRALMDEMKGEAEP